MKEGYYEKIVTDSIAKALENEKDKITLLESFSKNDGFSASLGNNWKHYNGERLNERFIYCNGYFGPSSGCNCVVFMELVIKIHSVK